MPQFGRKTRRNRNRWPGKGFLRWNSGMEGEGCWTVPAYQDPNSWRQDPEQAPQHWHHPHPSRQEIPHRAEPPSSSLPERISASHRLPGWGSSGIRVLLTRQGSICTACALIAALRRAGAGGCQPALAGGIWVRLARHWDLPGGRGCGSRGCGDQPGEAWREDGGVK